MAKATDLTVQPLAVAVLTVSDTRTAANDTSGDYLAAAATDAGHTLAGREIVIDDVYKIRALLSAWIRSSPALMLG